LGAGGALAQTVTMYGLMDAGVEVISNVGPGGTRLWRMPSLTGEFSSRLGLRGSEDLGGGLTASFVLEMGFAPDQGTFIQGGRAWGRQALVALSTPSAGSFSLGRQYTMLFWSLLDADILGPNLYGSGSLDAGIPNARADNALAWRGKFGGLSLGATWSLGRDTVNAGPSPSGSNCPGESSDSRACREWSVLAKYDTTGWGVAFADDRLYGRKLGASPDAIYGGLDSSAKSDDRLSLNGYLDLADARLSAGLVRRRNDGDALKPKSSLWYLAASYKATPAWVLDGEWLTLRYADVAAHDATLLALRATYSFSRSTAVYAQVGHISNQALSALSVSAGAAGSNPLPGGAQSGANLGLRHSF
jgi:predicted porin